MGHVRDNEGHPNFYRIVLPSTWEGHALRKEHRAGDGNGAFSLQDEKVEEDKTRCFLIPKNGDEANPNSEFMFLNLGPNHQAFTVF